MCTLFGTTVRSLRIGLIVCFAAVFVYSSPNAVWPELEKGWLAYDRGDFRLAAETAAKFANVPRSSVDLRRKLAGLNLSVYAKVALGEFDAADADARAAVSVAETGKFDAVLMAEVYLAASTAARVRGEHALSFDFAERSRRAAPDSAYVEGVSYLRFGQVFVKTGFDVPAIVWLDKAEKLLGTEVAGERLLLDVYRLLAFSWSAKSNYPLALRYSEKLVLRAKNSRFSYAYRRALFDFGNSLSAARQNSKAYSAFAEGLRLSVAAGDELYIGQFLSTLALNRLYENDPVAAEREIAALERFDKNGQYDFEVRLVRTIHQALKGDKTAAADGFRRLEAMNSPSLFLLPSWRAILARRDKNWEALLLNAQTLLTLATENNFRDELPRVHLHLATGYFRMGQTEKAKRHLATSMALVEEMIRTGIDSVSLGVYETYHEAFRLAVEMENADPVAAFGLADRLKARLLFDRLNATTVRGDAGLSAEIRDKFEGLSRKFIAGEVAESELMAAERAFTGRIPEAAPRDDSLDDLSAIPALAQSTVISYFFGLDGRLSAFVWEKESGVRRVEIDAGESELKALAIRTRQDIKSRVYFKRDGKALFDKLLRPLGATKKHLVIVPDKFLWTIPFQAMSPDGEKYLIEENLVTYAPSVSILAEQLRQPRPERRSLRAFANATFAGKTLRFVNEEAAAVSAMFGGEPVLGTTREKFASAAADADILHFSMHAELDAEQPLESFLGFRPTRESNGKMTVENLLGLKLKKGSLVFLASCDTNTVLSGEGLVSLSWGMTAAGATTVISAAWEANDKSSMEFTKAFYKAYKLDWYHFSRHKTAARM